MIITQRINMDNKYNNNAKPRNSTLSYENNTSFGSVKIFDEFKINQFVQEGKKYIGAAKTEIKNLISRNQKAKFTGDFDEITTQAEQQRKYINNDFWTFRKGKCIREVNAEEALGKEKALRSKEKEAEVYMDSANRSQKIVVETREKLLSIDPQRDIERQEVRKAYNIQSSEELKKIGFDEKIAGYSDEKEILISSFIREVEKEKKGFDAKVPGSVLFFGPTGTGKGTFAKAFAEEVELAGLSFQEREIKKSEIRKQIDAGERTVLYKSIKVSPQLSPDEKQKSLMDKLKKCAEMSAKQSNKRTIIVLDEFDQLGGFDKIKTELEAFMATCSLKYRCTLFIATNDPDKIFKNMNNPSGFETNNFPYRVALGPATKEQSKQIFRLYLESSQSNNNARISGKIDYNALTNALEIKTQNGSSGAFNNKQIRDFCFANDGEPITTQEKILESIYNSTPAIKPAAIQKFQNEENRYIDN